MSLMSARHRIPESFGTYVRLHKLGEGASSIVFTCRHTKTNEIYACKCVSREELVEAQLLMRFDQEVRILQSLHHPHITEIHDIVFETEFIFLILDYCPNGELFEFLVKTGRLTESMARELFGQLISAIEFIHSKGIAHRDIKPENILLDKDMKVKLGDFGLCHKSASKLLLSTPCGSPYYAPPEIISGDEYDGFKGDIWSLGVVLYTMVTKALPWYDLQPPALYNEILTGSYSIPIDISLPLKGLITGMMQVDPNSRLTVNQIINHPWMMMAPGISAVPSNISLGVCSKMVSKSSIDAFHAINPRASNVRASCKRIIVRPSQSELSGIILDSKYQQMPDIKSLIRKVPNTKTKYNVRRAHTLF